MCEAVHGKGVPHEVLLLLEAGGLLREVAMLVPKRRCGEQHVRAHGSNGKNFRLGQWVWCGGSRSMRVELMGA